VGLVHPVLRPSGTAARPRPPPYRRRRSRATARDTAGSSPTVRIAARGRSVCSVSVLMPAYQSS
jgi:hypothetical protein